MNAIPEEILFMTNVSELRINVYFINHFLYSSSRLLARILKEGIHLWYNDTSTVGGGGGGGGEEAEKTICFFVSHNYQQSEATSLASLKQKLMSFLLLKQP
jgi:hypothetical protein